MWRALVFAGVFVWATQADEADPLAEELEIYFAEIEEPFQPVTRVRRSTTAPLRPPALLVGCYAGW